ncbi:TIGR03619 family F420-dependent LLM class oxidoreductase [Streptomonospora nanhaiensis]|uniref:TIGR03619 family F420-dependent LLM class oxidoreductase n=1 Tax=Streptomonospora nanhaiensis TaxID=1323731 RepID=UPI001C3950E5|nr:TIGR03619 family F420-dependent LLM class oxidoreductase [Streptomonospora nanhaiensis]MBV2364004.1 TIGR03619 family F420-dependent LLM class oxidoreductase [Streptomonospora nanhaiensis]
MSAASPALYAVLPAEHADLDPRTVVDLARRAEDLGYGAVWLPDHPLPPAGYSDTYGGVFEPLVLLTAIAGATRSVRLGTSVLILPLRDPFLLAKQAATLERLAPGRLVLGVGAGWEEAEFTALGVDFADRGGRTDEALALIRHLHTVGRGPFEGPRFGFETGVFAPAPTAPVPLLVGGISAAALRRAARHSDVWQAVPGITAERFGALAAALRERAAGRPIETGARLSLPAGRDPRDAAEEIAALGAAGADHVSVWFGSPDGYADRMAALVRAVGR